MATRNHHPSTTPQLKQKGVSLIVGLIMLVLLTMLAITSFNMVNGNLQVVGNMQQRNEVSAAAQARIEEIISSTTFTTNPALVIVPVQVDTRGTGVAADKVTVTAATPVQIKCEGADDANAADSADVAVRACAPTLLPGGGTLYPCKDSVWLVAATAVDPVTGAKATRGQGVSVRLQGSCS